MDSKKKYRLILGVSLICSVSFNLSYALMNPEKTIAQNYGLAMESPISMEDTFPHQGFSISEGEIAKLRNKAEQHIENRRYEEAYNIYSQLINVIPQSATFHVSRAKVAMEMKDLDKSIENMRSASEKYEAQGATDNAQFSLQMAENLENNGFPKEIPNE